MNKMIYLILMLALLPVCFGFKYVYMYNPAPYNIGTCGTFGQLTGVQEVCKKCARSVQEVRQVIKSGDCVYPQLSVPIVYWDYKSYNVSSDRKQIDVILKSTPRLVQVCVRANTKTACVLEQQYKINGEWTIFNNITVNYLYSYKDEWLNYLRQR